MQPPKTNEIHVNLIKLSPRALGLIIVGYGILAIHVIKMWFGDWHVAKYLPWLTLDMFMMVSFALSFLGFIVWRYLKLTDQK